MYCRIPPRHFKDLVLSESLCIRYCDRCGVETEQHLLEHGYEVDYYICIECENRVRDRKVWRE